MRQAPLDLNVPTAKPINLPPPISQYDPSPGTHLNVSGWGFTEVNFLSQSHSISVFDYV